MGQHVRIKYSLGWPELDGTEGTVTSLNPSGYWVTSPDGTNVRVAPDMWGSEKAPSPSLQGATTFSPSASQLEPITDSYDLVSWESMRDLWEPEHLREDA